MQSKMGKGITVHTEEVDEIPLSNRGKLIPLIQKLKIEDLPQNGLDLIQHSL